jgi:hypothetical protein
MEILFLNPITASSDAAQSRLLFEANPTTNFGAQDIFIGN